MKSLAEEEAEQLSEYQTELRQQATESIQQLSSTLEQLSHDREEGKGLRDTEDSLVAEEEDKKTQSEAVNQLKSLLLKHRRGNASPVSPSKKHSPSKQEKRSMDLYFQDLVPVIHNQSEYIQHLEAQVKFCKEELQGLKQRISVVVVENEKMRSELKSKAVHESYIIKNSTMNDSAAANGHIDPNTGQSMLQITEPATWKNQLQQLKATHHAQIETLEAHVMSLRKDLSVSQKECEEVKLQLRQKENQVADALRAEGAPRVAGLCLKCAQHEAILPDSHASLAIGRLTKERDELLVALHATQASQQEAQQKEWATYLRFKMARDKAEEANLGKAELELRCKQLSRELSQHKQQLEEEEQALPKRLAEAREQGRAEARKQKEEVVNLARNVAELEQQLDRAHRDKSSMKNQLEDALCKLSSQEQDHAKASAELRHQLSRAQLKKEEAEREVRDINTKMDRQMQKAAQEVERLNSELVGCRRHLEAVQKDESQWQTEALSLAEQLANAQHQLHLTRKKLESEERAHKDELSSVTLSEREKQRELAVLLEQIEAQYQHNVVESDSLLSSQNSLIKKLKDECCTLVVKLKELTESSRNEMRQLTLQKQHLEETIKHLRACCSNLEEQCVQHGRMHQRMKTRLQQLDRHRQSSAQQVCELLAKQNQLMQERKTLKEDMPTLDMKVPDTSQADALSA